MITLLIVLGSLVAYLAIGGALAMRSLPRLWERGLQYWRHDSRFPELCDTGEKYARGGVVGGAIAWLFLWPFMLLYDLLAQRVDAANPHQQKRRIAEQESRIAELEHELGIRR